ncbi:MAG: hypothetical protein ACOC8Y_05890 [Candidatus Natronoplasma sp.]
MKLTVLDRDLALEFFQRALRYAGKADNNDKWGATISLPTGSDLSQPIVVKTPPAPRGTLYIWPEEVRYETASGLGVYTVTHDQVTFEGRRQSFRDGCEVFGQSLVEAVVEEYLRHPKTLKVESSQPEWLPWETEHYYNPPEIYEED